MIKEAIELIAGEAVKSAGIKVSEINGRLYTKDKILQVKEPLPCPISVQSLSGIIDYVGALAAVDKYKAAELMAHVERHDRVYLCAPIIEKSKERPCLIAAECDVPLFDFGQSLSIERFIIALQSRFIVTDDLEVILKFVSSLSHDQSASFEDNGVSQKVAVKKGVTQKQQVEVPNPVRLKPYRTFPEIDQPESLFIFRVKLNSENEPKCCLIEADGGAWRMQARKRIKEWIGKGAPQITVIA